MKTDLECWMVELPGVELKCFGCDKEGAFVYARSLGPNAHVWDMMSLAPPKGYDGDQKKEA